LFGEIITHPTLKLNKDRIYEQLFMIKVKRSDNINDDIFLIRDQKADSFISNLTIARNVNGAAYKGVMVDIYGEVIINEGTVEILVSADGDGYATGANLVKSTNNYKAGDLQSLDHY
jgi:hypothetical protein